MVSLMLTSEGIDTEGLYRTMNRVQSHTSERISQLSKELAERGLEAQIAQRELYKEDSIRKPPDRARCGRRLIESMPASFRPSSPSECRLRRLTSHEIVRSTIHLLAG